MSSARISAVVARSVVALLVAASVLAPVPAGAQDGTAARDQGRRGSGAADIDIDVLRVDHVEVEEAIGDVTANVEEQMANLSDARTALSDAETALGVAELELAEAQQRMDDLIAATDAVVINAFTNPPTEQALAVFSADSLADLSIRQAILATRASSDAETLEMYAQARDQLEIETADKEEAATHAEESRNAADRALTALETALGQQARFAVEVESRIDRRLSEAASLARLDPELAGQITARETALAGTLAGMQEAVLTEEAQELADELAAVAEDNQSRGIQDPPGGLATVTCPTGGSIQVAGDVAAQVQRMLDDAYAAGAAMCGTGYRDPQRQISLRRQHCGSSEYAIWEAPSSSCSPPTARPGSSLHEQGLALDLQCPSDTVSRGDACWAWLDANAADYGFENLPSESWHWSVDGT